MFKKLRERLPKKRSQEEIDEHFRRLEDIGGLEKNDLLAMFIAVVVTIVLPLLALLALIFGGAYLLFIR